MRICKHAGTVALCWLCIFGCANENEAAKKAKLALESRLSADEQSEVVAVIGDDMITMRDLERQLNAQTPLLRDQYGNAQRKLLFLTELVRLQLLANEALKNQLETDLIVQEAVTAVLADVMVDELGRAALRAQPVTEAELQTMNPNSEGEEKNLVQRSALRQKLVRMRKEKAVETLLEAHNNAREVSFKEPAWSEFKEALQQEKESGR